MLQTTANALAVKRYKDFSKAIPQESLSPAIFSETVSLLRDFFFCQRISGGSYARSLVDSCGVRRPYDDCLISL